MGGTPQRMGRKGGGHATRGVRACVCCTCPDDVLRSVKRVYYTLNHTPVHLSSTPLTP